MNHLLKNMLIGGAALTAFAFISSLIVAVTNESTKQQIATNERETLLRSLNILIPHDLYDNDIYNDTAALYSPKLLGSKKPVTVYRARKNQVPVAAIINSIAPDGYNGEIRLLVAILANGTLAGVRVVGHQETPGLGDAIDARRSDWIKTFNERSLSNPLPEKWRVKKDGGTFDQFTGATITPRAIVKAVFNTLKYYAVHREELFSTTPPPLISRTTPHVDPRS